MPAEKTVTFGIKIRAESNAGEAANSVDALRQRLETSQGAIKNYGASLRSLRGTSDEVKDAKTRLKAAINAERDAVSRDTLALGRLGKTLGEVQKAKSEEAFKRVATALGAVGGPVDALRGKWGTLTEVLGGTHGKLGAIVAISAGVVAAMVGITTAVTDTVSSWVKYGVAAADVLRTQSLFREAATGSAANATALGHQIEALAGKVPATREELNALSVELSRSLAGTRVSGQGMVDTFNAVATASSAMGDSAGKAIQEILTRGKQFGRLGLGFNELQGTGITFQDVAGQLAKDLKVGINAASRQLAFGTVKIDDGARAMREVLERRFGDINKRRLLSLDVQAAKLKDTLAKLFADVNLDPILEGFASLAKEFDTSTVSGSILKHQITLAFDVIGRTVKGAAPFVSAFFDQFENYALKFELGAIKVGIWARKTFGLDLVQGFDAASAGMTAAKVAFTVITAAAISTAIAVGALAVAAYGVYTAFDAAWTRVSKFASDVLAKDWGALGRDVGKALVEGLTGGLLNFDQVSSAVTSLGDRIKKTFQGALGIHSPSKVFEGYGKDTGEGYARGVESQDARAAGATRGLGAVPPTVDVRGAIAGGATAHGPISITVPITIHAPHARAEEVAAAMKAASFKAQLVQALEEALRAAGVPTMQGGT